MIKFTPEICDQDERGTITDLLEEQVDAISTVFTETGAVRGNHYHRKTFQWTYIIQGVLRVVTRDLDQKVREHVVGRGEMMLSPPMEAHAWEALEPTTAVVFAKGPRAGKNYESDTIRLDTDDRLIECGS